jgi:cell division protein FtsQ
MKTNKINTNSKEQSQKVDRTTIPFVLSVTFFIAVLISLGGLSWWLTQHFIGQESAPVTSVVISGEMPYSKRTDIMAAIEPVDLGNFFQVDVNEVQSKLLYLPWVSSVAVRKKWPNELKIYVVDHKPVALWNGEFLINQLGKVFQADMTRIKHYLPNFFGPEGTESLALKNYRDLNILLAFNALKIDELILSERFSWQLTLNDGITLNLGREERVERVQRFMDLYPIIKAELKAKKITEKQRNQAVDYIDLRYDTGLAVGWKSVTEITSNKNVENKYSNHFKSVISVKSLT